MHRCVICIGSNYNKKNNVSFAQKCLKELFPSICFDREIETKPIGLDNPALFTNQLAAFFTESSQAEVIRQLKQIELQAGRLPEDKKKEKIVLDIDLVKYDELRLKPLITELTDSPLLNNLLKNQTMKFIGIIPARYASTRFPAKPLAILGGKTVIQRVYEQVANVLDEAYVATDDERIEEVVKGFNGKVVMTSTEHKSGTDRCFEAYTKIATGADVIINIQGDEPFIQASQLQAIKKCFDDPDTQIATLVKPFTVNDSFDMLENSNSPKVVVDKNMNALYFSRSVIPYYRNGDKADWIKNHVYYKHIGLYAYKAEILKEITTLPQSSLELAESLEQLRWLENGYRIKVGITEVETIGIDTPEDLERAEQYLIQQEK